MPDVLALIRAQLLKPHALGRSGETDPPARPKATNAGT
jgi:hypothetical protein